MSKIDCNVITDLMPSYIDNICSKESKILIEEHLQGCEICQRYQQRMSVQDIKLDSVDNEQIDYMRKIRRMMDFKGILFFAIISIGCTIYLQKNYTPTLFFILLPVLLLSNYFMFFKYEDKGKIHSKKRLCAYVINLLIMLYMPFLILVLSNQWTNSSNYPFGLKEHQIGLFIYYQLITIIVVEIMFWIGTVMIYIKTSYFYMKLSAMSIIGMWLALYYIQLFQSLDSLSKYLKMTRMSLGILVEGFIMIGIIYIVDRFRRTYK